jgi:hypothetical protein
VYASLVRAVLARVALLVVSLVLALLAAEGVVRLLAPAPPPPPSHQHYYRADAEMGYDIGPDFPRTEEHAEDRTVRQMWSNELGCFDTDVRTGTPYVLLIGDSFTHGSTRFEDNWGTVLESRLGRRVLKCGVPGSGTRQQLIKARRIIARMRTAPELIVLGWFPNDLEDDLLFPRATVVDGRQVAMRRLTNRETGEIATYGAAELEDKVRQYERNRTCSAPALVPRLKCRLATRSRLVVLLGQAVRTFAARYPAVAAPLERAGLLSSSPQESPIPLAFASAGRRPWLGRAWQRHLESVAMFQALAAEQHAPLLVVLLPANFQVYPFLAAGYPVEVERPHDIVAAFLGERGIAHLDLLPVLRAHADLAPRARLDPVRDLYYRVDFHFSRRGNILAGLAVAEHIAQHQLLPVANALPRIREELARFRSGEAR